MHLIVQPDRQAVLDVTTQQNDTSEQHSHAPDARAGGGADQIRDHNRQELPSIGLT